MRLFVFNTTSAVWRLFIRFAPQRVRRFSTSYRAIDDFIGGFVCVIPPSRPDYIKASMSERLIIAVQRAGGIVASCKLVLGSGPLPENIASAFRAPGCPEPDYRTVAGLLVSLCSILFGMDYFRVWREE